MPTPQGKKNTKSSAKRGIASGPKSHSNAVPPTNDQLAQPAKPIGDMRMQGSVGYFGGKASNALLDPALFDPEAGGGVGNKVTDSTKTTTLNGDNGGADRVGGKAASSDEQTMPLGGLTLTLSKAPAKWTCAFTTTPLGVLRGLEPNPFGKFPGMANHYSPPGFAEWKKKTDALNEKEGPKKKAYDDAKKAAKEAGVEYTGKKYEAPRRVPDWLEGIKDRERYGKEDGPDDGWFITEDGTRVVGHPFLNNWEKHLGLDDLDKPDKQP